MDVLDPLIPSLGFIGAGNMAGALLAGTVGRGLLRPENVWACDKIQEKREALADLRIHVTDDPRRVADQVKTIVLAVKPQDALAVLDSIRDHVTAEHLIITIAAGKTMAVLGDHLPAKTRMVRVMPNTPALIGRGAAGVARGAHATHHDVDATLALFRAVGVAMKVDEKDMDAVTALSGSGPAYVFRFMELMIEAGVEMGLSADAAKVLTLETVLGAAQLATVSEDPLSELRRRVTSPGGTTAAALEVFEKMGLPETIKAGLKRAKERSIELSRPQGH